MVSKSEYPGILGSDPNIFNCLKQFLYGRLESLAGSNGIQNLAYV